MTDHPKPPTDEDLAGMLRALAADAHYAVEMNALNFSADRLNALREENERLRKRFKVQKWNIDEALRLIDEQRQRAEKAEATLAAQSEDFDRLKDKLSHAYETIDTFAGEKSKAEAELAEARRDAERLREALQGIAIWSEGTQEALDRDQAIAMWRGCVAEARIAIARNDKT